MAHGSLSGLLSHCFLFGYRLQRVAFYLLRAPDLLLSAPWALVVGCSDGLFSYFDSSYRNLPVDTIRLGIPSPTQFPVAQDPPGCAQWHWDHWRHSSFRHLWVSPLS